MKKIAIGIFLLLISFLVVGCNTQKEETKTEVIETEESNETEAEVNQETNKQLNITFNLKKVMKQGQVLFVGETNLPEGTIVMISLSNTKDYRAQDKQAVKAGGFITMTFSNNGNRLDDGTYTIEVSTPIRRVQPADIQRKFGEKSINLTGEFIQEDKTYGEHRLKYSETFTMGIVSENQTSHDDSTTKASDQEIYLYMNDQFNKITNYGETYNPEIHDPMIAQMAAEKFGITPEEADQIYIEKAMGQY